MTFTLSKRTFLICCGALVAYPYAAGYIAVSSACHVDGGTRIYERVLADGYLNVTGYSACVGCIEDLGAGRFSFVDHYVRNAFTNHLASEAGVNRYIIRAIDSEGWKRNARLSPPSPLAIIQHDQRLAQIQSTCVSEVNQAASGSRRTGGGGSHAGGQRTVLEYLLSPVQRVVSEAGMER